MTYDFDEPVCCGKTMTQYCTYTVDGREGSLWVCSECSEEITRDDWERRCEAQRDAAAERNADATGNAAPFCNADPFPFE